MQLSGRKFELKTVAPYANKYNSIGPPEGTLDSLK